MQAIKPSSRSETTHKTSPRSTNKSSSSSSSSSSPTAAKKSFYKAASQQPEKRNVARVPEMQQQLGQLREELKKAKEESSWALGELAEANEGVKRSEMLVVELDKAKESEREMLESLVSQTKQLEEAKISLEEAKLEIRNLEDRRRHDSSPEKIRILQNELKLATEAEERSKMAMDDLAIALHEVTAEANQATGRLGSAQLELKSAKEEVERLRELLRITDEKFRAAVEESEQAKLDLEESLAAWVAKENGFIECMKVSEEEMSKASRENDRLVDSQRMSRDDNSKLRDILKQAVNEASIVKETLEIARKENSQLKDILSEKEDALQRIKQDYEGLKVSEAAALASVRELKALLATTSTVGPIKNTGALENRSPSRTEVNGNEVTDSKHITTLPAESRRNENKPRIQIPRRHSVGGSLFDKLGQVEQRNQKVQSVSNVTDSLVASSLFSDDNESVKFDDFDHIDWTVLTGMEQDHGSLVKQKKKKPMMRKFGDMIRRRSFHNNISGP